MSQRHGHLQAGPGDMKLTTEAAGTQTMESKSTFIVFEDRPSDSAFVEKIWRRHSERGGAFLSVAASHFEMAVTRHKGKVFLTRQRPSTAPPKVSGSAFASNWARSCHDSCQEVSVIRKM